MKLNKLNKILFISLLLTGAKARSAVAADVVVASGSSASTASTSSGVTTKTTAVEAESPDFAPSGILMELGTVDQGYCDPTDPNFPNCVCPSSGSENQNCCSQPGHANYVNCDGDPLRKACRDNLRDAPVDAVAGALAACCTALGYTATCENQSDASGNSGAN